MAKETAVKERAWAGYRIRLEQSEDGWFYRIQPQALGAGAVAGPGEQLRTGPFSSEEDAFEDAKNRTLALQHDRPAGM